jgi:uncharacterized protein (TIGR03437 family)
MPPASFQVPWRRARLWACAVGCWGPSKLTVSTPGSPGILPRQLAGTRVLFNGVAAPLIYAWEPLASAVVPYGIADSPLQVVLEYQGVQSAPFQVQVAADSPASVHVGTRGADLP